MINLYFEKDSKKIIITINNKMLLFAEVKGNQTYATSIDGLKLSEEGIIKEFPELKEMPYQDMRAEAIRKFKEKIIKMKNEEEIKEYLRNDLKEHGYVLKISQRGGFRPIKEDGVT
jgi:hypothetical protein